jgi:galactofuranosylgalactofuranosylrhamnosyl-N-acetylglucosaminyl-diphospho-decaprenol beta-1,5/1,6-galactofuranosyltransferase
MANLQDLDRRLNQVRACSDDLEDDATVEQDLGVVLQRVVFDRAPSVSELYFRPLKHPLRSGIHEGCLRIPAGQVISFDTYFGAFFEQPWRAHTRIKSLALTLSITGDCTVRVVRRNREGIEVTLEERDLSARASPVSILLPNTSPALNAASRVYFEIRTRGRSAILRSATWSSPDSEASEVGLVPVFCTFNREDQLMAVLATIGRDRAATGAIKHLIIVNQGRSGLTRHPAYASLPDALARKVTVIEQPNYGGCGGFTRGMMEARDIPGATHVVLMDDDVEAEPESLTRMASFFSLAGEKVAVGGHMLDLLQPTRLYEAGARIGRKKWYLEPQRMHLRLQEARQLDDLLDARPVHYNGWWLFGVPLNVVDQAGLPLPCFIRGDDVEYGIRLHDQGIYTIGLPGVAIWHEPFYVKLGSWHLYYEMRNMLAAAAIHFPRRPVSLAFLLLKRQLIYLLTYRYYSAALILRAIEDYLHGPSVLRAPPQDNHALLESCKTRFPPRHMDRDRVVPDGALPRDPRGLAGFVFRLMVSLGKNALVPVSRQPVPAQVHPADLVWFRVGAFDEVVSGSEWDLRPPVYRRSVSAFRRLMLETLRVLVRVIREGDTVTMQWKAAYPDLTSAEFWRRYLHVGSSPAGDLQNPAVPGGMAGKPKPGVPQPGRGVR